MAGVGDDVGGRLEVGQDGVGAVPAQQLHGGQVGADQVERVVVGQSGVVVLQLLEGLRPVGGGQERELAS
jgi:hypothetical protein